MGIGLKLNSPVVADGINRGLARPGPILFVFARNRLMHTLSVRGRDTHDKRVHPSQLRIEIE
jgi:hypothetical protein